MASQDTTFVSKTTNIVVAWCQALNDWLWKGVNPLFVVSTGSANAQVITLPATSLKSALSSGDTFTFRAGFSNSGATTITVVGSASLGAPALQVGGNACVGGELVVNSTYTVVYNATTVAFDLVPRWFISAFIQTLITAASAAAARIVLGAAASGSNSDITNLTGMGVLTNTRLAKTTTYAVANGDKGKTLALGGSAFYAVTIAAASGFDANFCLLILNEDTSRGKSIQPNGGTTFILYPGQSVMLFNQNNAWKLSPSQQRWRVTASVNVYVDPTNGSDSNDGLAAGTGNALATIQKAINLVVNSIDSNGFTQTIQLADSLIYTESVTVVGAVQGAVQFNITGNTATPANVLWTGAAGATIIAARDKGTVTVAGITFASVGGAGSRLLVASQFGTIDVGAGCVFGACASGVHFETSDCGAINVLNAYTISGSAVNHILNQGTSHISLGGQNVTITGTPTFTTFAAVNYVANLRCGGAITYTGAVTAGAQKYTVTTNATLELDGTTFPGSVAGSTATGGQITA